MFQVGMVQIKVKVCVDVGEGYGCGMGCCWIIWGYQNYFLRRVVIDGVMNDWMIRVLKSRFILMVVLIWVIMVSLLMVNDIMVKVNISLVVVIIDLLLFIVWMMLVLILVWIFFLSWVISSRLQFVLMVSRMMIVIVNINQCSLIFRMCCQISIDSLNEVFSDNIMVLMMMVVVMMLWVMISMMMKIRQSVEILVIIKLQVLLLDKFLNIVVVLFRQIVDFFNGVFLMVFLVVVLILVMCVMFVWFIGLFLWLMMNCIVCLFGERNCFRLCWKLGLLKILGGRQNELLLCEVLKVLFIVVEFFCIVVI